MRYIHCTQKLIKEINPHIKSYGEDREIVGFGDWHANVISIMKRNYLVFTNIKTLYTFFVADIYRDDIENFSKLFISRLILSLENRGFGNELILKVVNEYSEIEIVKTKNKSVNASMNDHVQRFYEWVEEGIPRGIKTIEEFNKSIVNIPMGALKYHTSLEKLKELITKEIA